MICNWIAPTNEHPTLVFDARQVGSQEPVRPDCNIDRDDQRQYHSYRTAPFPERTSHAWARIASKTSGWPPKQIVPYRRAADRLSSVSIFARIPVTIAQADEGCDLRRGCGRESPKWPSAARRAAFLMDAQSIARTATTPMEPESHQAGSALERHPAPQAGKFSAASDSDENQL